MEAVSSAPRSEALRSEALRLAQAVALEAVEALEALARMLRSTLSLVSMAHGTGAIQQCAGLPGA